MLTLKQYSQNKKNIKAKSSFEEELETPNLLNFSFEYYYDQFNDITLEFEAQVGVIEYRAFMFQCSGVSNFLLTADDYSGDLLDIAQTFIDRMIFFPTNASIFIIDECFFDLVENDNILKEVDIRLSFLYDVCKRIKSLGADYILFDSKAIMRNLSTSNRKYLVNKLNDKGYILIKREENNYVFMEKIKKKRSKKVNVKDMNYFEEIYSELHQ